VPWTSSVGRIASCWDGDGGGATYVSWKIWTAFRDSNEVLKNKKLLKEKKSEV